MDNTTFMISSFCLIDDWLQSKKLRERGPAPRMRDSEVLTMEIVGEFLGMDTDKEIYHPFRLHYSDWFPGIAPDNAHHLRASGCQFVGGQISVVANGLA